MIRRDCKSCKSAGEQSWNQCGYIEEDKRRDNKIDFPALKNPHFTISVCPVWYYNEYEYLYDLYNLIKDSALNLLDLPFSKRFIYKTFKYHLSLRQEYERKKQERKKKGRRNGR